MWNGQSIQSLPLWSGNPKTIVSNNLIVSSIQTNFISTAIINVSSIFTNYLSSATANIPNLNVSTINGNQLSNYSASNWSYYPARTQVEMAYNNLHNAGNVNMKGNFTMDGTGNNFSPYWYNAQIDANIKTGASGNLFNPTNVQYFSDYSVKNINVDINYGVLSYETASHKMYPASILPVGRNVLNAKNFNLSLPYSGFLAGNYRGYGELSVDGGDGTSCYLKLNPDIITTSVPNTASLSYYNGDSYLASITELGVSRVGVTFGRVINLATYEARLSAGYVGTLNSYLPVCEILSYAPAGGAGGGTTTNIVNGGAFGARNDLIAYNNFTDGGLVGVAMEIGSRGTLDIYSGGDLHIGKPKSTYFDNTQGAVYISKCEEIYVNNIFGGLIDGIKVRNSMDMCNRNITNLANLNGLPVSNYNNSNWSLNNAISAVNMCNYDIKNCGALYTNAVNDLNNGTGITLTSSNGDLTLQTNATSGGSHNLQLNSVNDVSIYSAGAIITTADTGSIITIANTGNIECATYTGNMSMTSADTLNLTSAVNTNITASGGTVTTFADSNVETIANQGNILLQANVGNIEANSIAGNISLLSAVDIGLTTYSGNITLNSTNDTNITGNAITLTATGSLGGVGINLATQTTASDLLVHTVRGSAPDIDFVSTDGTFNFGTEPSSAGTDVNVRANRSFQLFGGNTNGGGTTYDGDVKFETGNNVEFKSNNGGLITLRNDIAFGSGRTDNRDIFLSAGKNGYFQTVGSLVLNSSTGGTTLGAQTNIAITSATATVSLTSGAGQNVNINNNLNMTNKNIINANTITGQTALTLATTGATNINLSPATGGTIVAGKTLNMNTNAISGVTTLNGRNLFAYGNFYNTATQTLGAINTATRVIMNTSLNNNLITLDSVTNIGRITFTNAGVYHVVWNAYLFHGFGGTIKSVIWIRLNGTDVAGSGKTENNDATQNETNMTSSSIVSVTAGQYIEFYWSANSVNVPLTAISASTPYPATPSFSCSINIVG